MNLSKVVEVSKKCDKPVSYVFGVVVEEVGEISTAINRPHKAPEPAINEIADAIIALTDLAMKVYDGGEEALQQAINRKVVKWEKSL